MNAEVGRCSAIAAAATAASNLVRITSDPPASRVPPPKRMGAEWCIGEHTRCTSARSKPHSSASSAARARASASASTPDHTPFGRPVVPEV